MKKLFVLLVILLLGMATTSNAELTTIGTATYEGVEYKLIYDDTQNLVWLDYTSLYAFWPDQVDWAASLNGEGVLTYNLDCGVTIEWGEESSWRLPTTESTATSGPLKYGFSGPDSNGDYVYDYGHNRFTTGEMNHLFYTALGNLAQKDTNETERAIGAYGLLNTGDFDNLISYFYWSGTTTEYGAWPGTRPPVLAPELTAWFFGFHDGMQEPIPKFYTALAIAVRPAHVIISERPETKKICEILAFFEESVDKGILRGSGCKCHAKSRLCFMRKMLKRLERYVDEDNTREACSFLKRCYKRCDGRKRPSDFVTGEATGKLAEMIYDLSKSLGCRRTDGCQ